jgi:hypothetical protein
MMGAGICFRIDSGGTAGPRRGKKLKTPRQRGIGRFASYSGVGDSLVQFAALTAPYAIQVVSAPGRMAARSNGQCVQSHPASHRPRRVQ